MQADAEVTGSESDWLDRQIALNGKVDAYDQALLDFIAEECAAGRKPHAPTTTVKLSPQPQAPFALGLSKMKPAAKSSSLQSIVLPTR